MTLKEESAHFLDYWRIVRSRKEIVIALFLLIVVSGVLITLNMSKTYTAYSLISVQEDRPDVPLFQREVMLRYDPSFLRTQYQIIQSRPILEDVISEMELHRTLGAAYGFLGTMSEEDTIRITLAILGNSVRVQQYRDTNLIEIRVSMQRPVGTAHELAAEIANTMARVFRRRMHEETSSQLAQALQAIDEARKTQEKRVAEAKAEVERRRTKYNISVLRTFVDAGVSDTLDKQELQLLLANRQREELTLMEKKTRYEKFMALPKEERVASAVHIANALALSDLIARKRSAEVEINRMLEAALGPRHPDVINVQAMIETLTTQIDRELAGIQTAMATEVAASEAKMIKLNTDLADLREREIRAEGEGYRAFFDAVEELQRARRIHEAIELRYYESAFDHQIPRTTVEIKVPAKAPSIDAPSSPNLFLNVFLSGFIGIVFSLGLVFFLEYMDTSIKTIDEIERLLDMSVLGVIPQKVAPLIHNDRNAGAAEAYRVLRANIQFSKRLKGNALCVTSGGVGEGKSLTVFNLAYICATLGERVMLVDADLRRPRQHKILECENTPGLANILIGETDVNTAIRTTSHPNLFFLPSGKVASGAGHGLLDTSRMLELIASLKASFDIVLFDGPPMIGVSDASILARDMDGVLMVVQHRRYPRSISQRAKTMLENVGATILGVVLNNINIARDYSYYYHHYYYSHPSTDSRKPDTARRNTPGKEETVS